MRPELATGDRKILLIAAGVFVAMLTVVLLFARGASSDADIPSTYSAASGGCKAAFLLLQESGFREQTWERSLGELPAGKGTTLIIADPEGFPAEGEKDKLATFLRSGGRLIASGRFVGFYLPVDDEAASPLAGSTLKHVSALSPSPITRAAPGITLTPLAYWRPGRGAVALYGESDRPVVVEYRVGEGSVLWLAEPGPLTNAGLKEEGNLEFLLSAVGRPEDNNVLWDEYVHGHEQQRAASRKSRKIIGWIFLQLAVFGTAILATYSRRSGPLWTPAIERRLSPLEFVRTLGVLYERANAGSVAIQIFYQRFRYLLTRRLGLSANATVNDLDRAVRERGLKDAQFADTLNACESCKYDLQVASSTALRLAQSLFDFALRLKLVRSRERENNLWKQL
jgi:hypothetical protein